MKVSSLFFATILMSLTLKADEIDDIFSDYRQEAPLAKTTNYQDTPSVPNKVTLESSSSQSSDPNPSARFGTSRSWNFYVEGEVIWFKPYNDEYSEILFSNNAPQNTFKFFEFNFQPGVRALLGLNTNYDGWDINLIYTGLNYSHSNSYLSETYGNWKSDGSPKYYSSGTQKYTYYYNQGDLELGRMFKLSKGLQVRPHAGFRSIWLVQKNSLYTTNGLLNFNPDQTVSNLYDISKIKGYLPGVALGSNALWRFTKSWSVITDLTFAALINNSKRSFNQYFKGGPINFQRISGMAHDGIFGYDFTIGLEWDKNFCRDKLHLGLKLAYEQHGLININNVLDSGMETGGFFTSAYTNYFRPLIDNDFTLMGISLGARLDF